MPVLISAAAIQLTFGLQKYLLPNFEFIHVYPKEFIRIQDTICYLEGNVSGHAINLSWKHFLDGYANSNDGQNVGLHELAHALYYQTFIVEENVDGNFRDTFDHFNNFGNKVFDQELQPGNDLYTDYALKNFQEFWAESAEIFFEKPAAMKAAYPQLYDAVKSLLNQDPYNKIALTIT
jgi:Mlc titration factor MtfA (ptsG expression regulator)